MIDLKVGDRVLFAPFTNGPNNKNPGTLVRVRLNNYGDPLYLVLWDEKEYDSEPLSYFQHELKLACPRHVMEWKRRLKS